jgi:hypothetical protein
VAGVVDHRGAPIHRSMGPRQRQAPARHAVGDPAPAGSARRSPRTSGDAARQRRASPRRGRWPRPDPRERLLPVLRQQVIARTTCWRAVSTAAVPGTSARVGRVDFLDQAGG